MNFSVFLFEKGYTEGMSEGNMRNTDKIASDSAEILKKLTSRDFLALGIHDVAYVKPVQIENRTAYAIHAADGTPLSVMDDRDSAVGIILHNALEPVTLH